jgi:uncharacterized protein YerC
MLVKQRTKQIHSVKNANNIYTYFWGFLAMEDTHSMERWSVARLIAPRTATRGARIAPVNMLLTTAMIYHN